MGPDDRVGGWVNKAARASSMSKMRAARRREVVHSTGHVRTVAKGRSQARGTFRSLFTRDRAAMHIMREAGTTHYKESAMANRSNEWRANCWGRHEEALCERAGRHGPAHPERAGYARCSPTPGLTPLLHPHTRLVPECPPAVHSPPDGGGSDPKRPHRQRATKRPRGKQCSEPQGNPLCNPVGSSTPA